MKTRLCYGIKEIIKIAKEYREVKKMKMDEGDSQIIYIKYKEEENTSKTLLGEILINNRGKEN